MENEIKDIAIREAMVDVKSMEDEHRGKYIIIHSENGSYFCILRSLDLDESCSSISATVTNAWKIDGSQKKLTTDDKLIKDAKISTMLVYHICDDREYVINRIKLIEYLPDTINQMHAVIQELR